MFHATLETLGANNLFDDEDTIRTLWTKLRETDPSLLRQFEGFLKTITGDVKRAKVQNRQFETALQTKSSLFDDEIKRLYDEMEQQIQAEKQRILDEVSRRRIAECSPK